MVAEDAERRTHSASRGRSMTLQGDSYVQLSVEIEGYIDYINPYYIPRNGGALFALCARRALDSAECSQ